MPLLRCVAGAMALRPSLWRSHRSASFSLLGQHHHRHALSLSSSWPKAATFLALRSVSDDNHGMEGQETPQPMENLYLEWSLEHDQLLWQHRNESPAALAERLGHGLRGVKARLDKLKDVNSPAYERLFAADKKSQDDALKKKAKLVPVSEVLRRIQWYYSLSPTDFSMLHYDRVDDQVAESPLDAPSNSIKGSGKTLVDALSEHRLVGIKSKEQIVWDREKRLDIFFSGCGIEQVVETYDEWKKEKHAKETWLRQRQAEADVRFCKTLALDRYKQFKALLRDLKSNLMGPSVSSKVEAETFVASSLALFNEVQANPSASLKPSLIPRSDLEALDCLSELVALSPNQQVRAPVLNEISFLLQRIEGGPQQSPVAVAANSMLPELNEDELTETFVRGTGPGGQKINKTNNKVLLVHNPTQLRVEC